MAKSDTQSISTAFLAAFISSGVVFFLSSVPIIGGVLSTISPISLVFAGSTTLLSTAFCASAYIAAYIWHFERDQECHSGEHRLDNRLTAAVHILSGHMSIGVMYRMTQNIKLFGAIAGTLSGSAVLGALICGLWVFGAPIAMGVFHYMSAQHQQGYKPIDSVYITIQLFIGALAGVYTSQWDQLNPFAQSSRFQSVLKMLPVINNPQVSIERIVGCTSTMINFAYLGLRGDSPSLNPQKPSSNSFSFN
jgi:hypothetical protein